MKPFILVFSEGACQWMIAHGYSLVQKNQEQGYWVFASGDNPDMTSAPFGYATSDILTF